MFREAQSDFLPWILGALVAAIAALALVIHEASNRKGLPAAVPASAAAPAPAASASAATRPVPAVAGGPVTPLAPPIPPTVVPVSRTDLPPGQVYECNQNGQHIFSDAPCGDRPAIRQLSEVNRMAAVPVAPDSPRARFAQPAPYPGPEADYGPTAEQPPSNDSTPGVLLYPAPLVPYRYRQHDEHPRYLPRPASQHPGRAPARDLSSGRG